MDLKQTGSSCGRVRLKPRAQLWVKLGIGAEEGSECRLRFIVNSSFRRTRFQTPVIWVAGGRCNRETPSSINTGVTRWPLGWLSVQFPDALSFPTCYFYVSVGSLQALWPSTPPKTAKKEISCGANKVFSTGFIYNIFPLCFIIGGGTTGDFTKRRYRNIELAPRC